MPLPDIPITVAADGGLTPFERVGEPVTVGVGVERGRTPSAEHWVLTDPGGRDVPVQTEALDRWSDGSVRWLLVDFQATISPGEPAIYTLRHASGSAGCRPDRPVIIEDTDRTLMIQTGVARVDVARTGHFFFSPLDVIWAIDPGRSGIRAQDAGGVTHALDITAARVERRGPMRAVIRLDGTLRANGSPPLAEMVTRLHFFAGLGCVRVEVSVTNPRPARHRGGYWDLGDPGSIFLRDLCVEFAHSDADSEVGCSPEPNQPFRVVTEPVEIYQDSSGGENWRHVNHCNRRGDVTTTFRGYRFVTGLGEHRGMRATPIVSIGDGPSQLTVAVPAFWQNFPKALEARGGIVTVRLFPRQSTDVHELQGGERKTHTFVICVGPDTISDVPLAWSRSPARCAASSSSYHAARAWTALSAGSEDGRRAYDRLVDAAIEGPTSMVRKRETIDEFGWRDFGDLYADHEAVREVGLVSHYNNQYDAIAGFATRFFATGDHRWRTLMDELLAHVIDIDLYHCVSDRAAYNGGLFWHTSHYLKAHTATHRSFSRRMGIPGGGPSAEHNYTTGLMLHYFLTGSDCSREAVVQLAQWVLDMDDGRKSRFWWLDRGDTGLASATFTTDYSPGRGAGNSINALLDAHRLTGDGRFLRKAEQLVMRCVHPSDDPGRMNLLDAERRWSYTVFLQNIGKFLEYRAEMGSVDDVFRYARAVLLRYADWMADAERPYLDHPERLEFPTETWAAQDIRKAAVFEYAASHAVTEADSVRFARKGDAFFTYAVSTLQEMATRGLTRPVVLLLAYSFQRPTMAASGLDSAATAQRFYPVAPFVPLKRRVFRKLALLATMIAAGAIVALGFVWLR